MGTAVIDIEFENPPDKIAGLERYSRALVLVRLNGRPIGKVFVPVTDGCVGRGEIHEALMSSVDWSFWENLLHGYLGWDEVRRKNFPLPRATVAVCTRDRTEDLKRCIEALVDIVDEGHELVVVDNCPSTDSTYRLIQGYRKVRYIREDRPGLNVARNRALREARYEIVAFCDDDAVVDCRWLQALLLNFDDPRVMCVTGLTMPLELETEAQEWFEQYSSFGKGFRRMVFDSSNINPLAAGGRVGAGVNMALRRSVLKCVGPFDEALDAGTPTFSGGDTEMFSRILAYGYRIVYEPAALSWHRHRRTLEELVKTMYGYGVGVYAFWTRSALLEGEFVNVIRAAWNWFFRYQLRHLMRSFLRRPGSVPPEIILAELKGCAMGPWAYLRSRRALNLRNGKKSVL